MVSIVIIAVTIAVAIGLLVVYKKSIFGTFGEAGKGIQDFFGGSTKGIQSFFQDPLGLGIPEADAYSIRSDKPPDFSPDSPDSLTKEELEGASHIQLPGDGSVYIDGTLVRDPLPKIDPFADFTKSLTDKFTDFSKSVTDALDFNPVPQVYGDDTTTIPNASVDDTTTIPKSEVDRTNNIDPDILKRFPYFESFTPAAQERILKNFLSRQSTTEHEIPDTPTAQRKRVPYISSSIQGKQFTGSGSTFIGGTVRKSEFDEPTLRSKRQESDRIKEARRLAQEARDKAVAGLNRKNKESSDRNDELIRRADEANRKHHGKFFGKTPEQIALELTGGNISNF